MKLPQEQSIIRLIIRASMMVLLFLENFMTCLAQDVSWACVGSPYRATIFLREAPLNPESGVLIELPEFGATRPDLEDLLLTDAAGTPQPLAKIRRVEGETILLLAHSLAEGKPYHLYFGGEIPKISPGWQPKISLLMETRRLPPGAQFGSWTEMQNTWQQAGQRDGAGFVGTIFHGGNPFGPGSDYVTHYTGWLRTSGLGELLLYTLSSDASFVLINDNFEFAWPGTHEPWANEKNIHSKLVKPVGDFIKVDYYHAKIGSELAGSVLGWRKNGKLETIPANAWLHSGSATLQNIENRLGQPVPLPSVEALSVIGYGNQWYEEMRFSLSKPLPSGWSAQWEFEDGATIPGSDIRRILVGNSPQTVVLKLRGSSSEVRGLRRFFFSPEMHAASVNIPADVERYSGLLAAENPEKLSPAYLEASLRLLFDFEDESRAAPFAKAWLLAYKPDPRNPLWFPATEIHMRSLAHHDPRKAIEMLHGMDSTARNLHARELAILELELLVLELKDESVPDACKRISVTFPNTDIDLLARICIGDYYRLTERLKEAAEQYQSVEKSIGDESGEGKLPAQERAYSISISTLLQKGRKAEASQKLTEWELRHPKTKLESDFLLLRGRLLAQQGRWTEGLMELDSFKKVQSGSPWVIDADYYRAGCLEGLGRKEEARTIWASITKDYPKHELAPSAALKAKSR